MKHRAKKAKFGYGKDANQMLLRKLASNFFVSGKLETTKQKAKAAQSEVERMVTKAKTNTEADRNYIRKHITTNTVMDLLINQIAGQLGKVGSGYTRIVKLNQRITDGAQIARLEWAYPVVLKKDEVKPVKNTKQQKAETPVKKATEVKSEVESKKQEAPAQTVEDKS
jgi:large subunit ribosomal protein L17